MPSLSVPSYWSDDRGLTRSLVESTPRCSRPSKIDESISKIRRTRNSTQVDVEFLLKTPLCGPLALLASLLKKARTRPQGPSQSTLGGNRPPPAEVGRMFPHSYASNGFPHQRPDGS